MCKRHNILLFSVNKLYVLCLEVKLHLSEFEVSPLPIVLILSEGHSQSPGTFVRHWDASSSFIHRWHALCTFSWVPPLFPSQSLFRITDSLAHVPVAFGCLVGWGDHCYVTGAHGTLYFCVYEPPSSPVSCSPSWAEVEAGGSRGKMGSLGDLVAKLPWLLFVILLFPQLRYR